jgi:hypothetical protein
LGTTTGGNVAGWGTVTVTSSAQTPDARKTTATAAGGIGRLIVRHSAPITFVSLALHCR